MSKIQVLVACMHQQDDTLYREMNLQTDAVLANQSDRYEYKEYNEPDGSKVQLITSFDRGVGKNRNKALSYATGEYLLCSDQDMIYVDNYAQIVTEAFQRYPKADIIVFRLEYLNRFTPPRKEENKPKRVRLWNCMRYGTARVAIKRGAVEKNCLSFSPLYGGGAVYSSGEDSLFIRDAFRKGLKMYSCPTVIAKVKQEESSWFKGYTQKYFVDKGILIANAFPFLKYIFLYYFAFGMRNITEEYGFLDICRFMKTGFREYKKI
ncbi:MAG: glycosyltransferase family 2 protein [Clostridiales bacterium]|jgi:glycosyltransferase involved in cell wall biosynthesis|nr:glycosyltransferase family 2 protein [Clostridiales bacterium]